MSSRPDCCIRSLLLIAFVGGQMLLPALSVAQDDDAEKRVTFYTTYGYLENDVWTIPLKAWVHEEPDFARRFVADAARGKLQQRAQVDNLDQTQKLRFEHRIEGFIADSESRETVRFVFDADPESIVYRLRGASGESTTDRNGLIHGTINVTREKATELLERQNSIDGWLTFRARADDQSGSGRVRLIPPDGVSVISDVDDTIKVTEIPAGETAVLNNTFFRPFRAAACMAEHYSAMHTDTAFHYVSGGPWQMYEPLAEFLFTDSDAFPEGSFHMKDVRTNPFETESYTDIWALLASGSQQATFEQKVRQIDALLGRFPGRKFILIGDSGEKDPEVFAEVLAAHGRQILGIFIRDVVNAAANDPQRLHGMSVILPTADDSGACVIINEQSD
ncbi:MAG: phosphatidate phosphatase App1 family protein [Woeseiaceae bacterium]